MRMRGREFKLRLTEDEHSHLEKQAKKPDLQEHSSYGMLLWEYNFGQDLPTHTISS